MKELTLFEKKMARLEEINRLLREGTRPLGEILELYEEGIRVFRETDEMLAAAEMRIETITQELLRSDGASVGLGAASAGDGNDSE